MFDMTITHAKRNIYKYKALRAWGECREAELMCAIQIYDPRDCHRIPAPDSARCRVARIRSSASMSRSATARIGPHVVVEGHTRIGRDNEIFQFCSTARSRRTRSTTPSPTRLEIGDRNTIREFCSFNVGTSDANVTRIGNDNRSWPSARRARLPAGDHTIFANNATLAGHVHVGDWAIRRFHWRASVLPAGAHSFCGVGTVLLQDLPPFVTVSGNPAKPHINSACCPQIHRRWDCC